MYYRARYYDPTLGRFVSADTILPRPRCRLRGRGHMIPLPELPVCQMMKSEVRIAVPPGATPQSLILNSQCSTLNPQLLTLPLPCRVARFLHV
ncbi:MAG: hypothetical protein GVY30_11260 [Chloroflexi bacterium]|jgi:hypothetical protein|nr:hypothetical protein [Chloroflexota bacterium]